MCEWARVSRASFYRHWEGAAPSEAEMALRQAVQQAALSHRFYGYRRVLEVVRREGYEVGGKRVRRLLREDNLLAIRRRKFVATTDSGHGSKVYPNLAQYLELTQVNQLWVADLTYVRWVRSSCFWRWCWMRFRGGRWAGRWVGIWMPVCPWRPCAWPSRAGTHCRVWCTIPTRDPSTPVPIMCSVWKPSLRYSA
jgi:transposase InsO family protein